MSGRVAKKKVNITVKKTPTPFQFPGSTTLAGGEPSPANTAAPASLAPESKQVPMIVPISPIKKLVEYPQTVKPAAMVVKPSNTADPYANAITNANAIAIANANATGDNTTPTEEPTESAAQAETAVLAEPPKRGRGRPRKDAAAKKDPAVSKESGTVKKTSAVKKRGRKPKENQGTTETGEPGIPTTTNQAVPSSSSVAELMQSDEAEKGQGKVVTVGPRVKEAEGTGGRARSTETEGTGDKVYSLFQSRRTVDIDNFEHLSYIVNLKITKSRADAIFAELMRTQIGKGTEAGSGEGSPGGTTVSPSSGRTIGGAGGAVVGAVARGAFVGAVAGGAGSAGGAGTGGMVGVGSSMVFPQPSREAVESFDNIFDPKESERVLPNIYRPTSPKIDRRKVHLGDGAFRTRNPSAEIGLALQNMEQVTVRTQVSSGFADCYIGELMAGFSMGDRWPLRSDYPCRNCDETFTNTPAGLVRRVEGDFEVDPENCKFYLYLNFCSWPCALRYAYDRLRNWMDQQFLLNFCYNTVQKYIDPKHKWSKIRIAPELGTLRKNGGPLSIEQYRAATGSNKSYNIYIPPLIPLRLTLEESSRDLTTRSSAAGGRDRGKGRASNSKFVPMDVTRMKKAEMSIRNRKNSVRGTMTIDKLMKMEVKTIN